MLIGYMRISTGEQNLDLQRDALERAGCERIYDDVCSGRATERPGLAKALDVARDGDALVVWKLDRIGRSTRYLDRLKERDIEKPTAVDEMHRRVMEITGDPLPYGLAPNRRVIDELIQHALTQGIITKAVTADELFVPSTRKLVG